MYEWLQELKEGDTVVIENGWGQPSIRTVERVTKTQITIGNCKYRRANGYMVGADSWSRWSLREPTPTAINAAKRCDAIGYLKSQFERMDYRNAPDCVVEIAEFARTKLNSPPPPANGAEE